MPLTIERPHESVAIIAIDEACAQSLLEAVEDLAEQGVRTVVIDYDAINFCNSLDIAQVLSARSLLVGLGGRLALCNLKPTVVSIYRVLKLERLFCLTNGRERCLQELGLA